MKSRTISALFLVVVLMFGMIVPVSASAYENCSIQMQQLQVNEFDLYNAIKKLPEAVLLENGYSEDVIEEIKSVDYKELVYQRARLSDNELRVMGYTESEVEMLRNYNGTEAETGLIAGTLTGKINCLSASASEYKIEYAWEWDHSPLVMATDAMGMRWIAIASDGLPVDVSAYNSVAEIYLSPSPSPMSKKYYPTDSNFANETDFNALTCTFAIQIGSFSVLSGKMTTTIKKDASVTRNIQYLKVCGVYGHTVANIGAPSVSFTSGSTSIGISFTGGLNTDNIGIKKYKIYNNG